MCAISNSPPAFNVTLKPRGAICNLDCQYCYYLNKEALYPGSSFRMSDETLEIFTRQYIEAQKVPEVTFSWQGGEPTLMGLDFYRKAVAYQKKYRRPGMQVNNTFQTNGTLLDQDWCLFFQDNNFLVGLSLDGPKSLHDAYRINKGGDPTFEGVMAGLALLKKHAIDFNILTTVHNLNASYPLQVYRFLRDEVQAQFLQFIPIVDRNQLANKLHKSKVNAHSISALQYGDFLITIFDEWIQHDVGQTFVQIFDVALAVSMGMRAGLCIFEPTCGQALAMEHNGDLYACDHFVEPDFKLGNIHQTTLMDLISSPAQTAFGQNKLDKLPTDCRECNVRFICNGGCPKDRILTTKGNEEGLNYLCAGYKAFFNHIQHPMQIMAYLLRSGRPATDIMHLNWH